MTSTRDRTPAHTSEVPIEGKDLHYLHLGRRRSGTILFLHGITESRRYFARPVASLADRFELLIPDLPGFGLSPKPVVRYSMDLFRDAIRSFVEHHGMRGRRLHLVGHSLGCLVALEYASAFPERVGKMVLLNLPRHFSSHEAHGIFFEGSASYRKLLQERSLRASLGQIRKTGLTMSLRYARRFPWAVLVDARKFTFLSLTSTLENCLIHYQVDTLLPGMPPLPTLLVHGERDQVAPFRHVRPLPDEYPWMRLLAFPRSGHHVLHTHTPQVVGAIRRFLLDGAS